MKPEGCSSCNQYIAWAVSRGDLTRLPSGLLYNDPGGNPSLREYVDPKTCFMVWADGSLRNKRLHNDGTICPECAKPSPCPSPSPTPVPSPTPTPSGAPPLTESGNYPVPQGSCPPWFANAVSEVGISVLNQRKCDWSGGADCTLTNLNATEKSVKPFCEHSCYDEQGRYSLANCRNKCETVRACQQPEFVNGNTGIQMIIWGEQVERGDCDKRTAEGPFPDNRRNFICHDRAEDRRTPTNAQACEPDGTRCGPVIQYRSLP